MCCTDAPHLGRSQKREREREVVLLHNRLYRVYISFYSTLSSKFALPVHASALVGVFVVQLFSIMCRSLMNGSSVLVFWSSIFACRSVEVAYGLYMYSVPVWTFLDPIVFGITRI